MNSTLNNDISFYVSPLFIKLSKEEIALKEGFKIRLRDFQYELLKRFYNREEREVIIVKAPTGSGKTLSLLIPLIANIKSSNWMYHGSVGIYPSRELARDQFISIYNLLLKIGAEPVDIRDFYSELKSIMEEERGLLNEYIRIVKIYLGSDEPVYITLLLISSESLKDIRGVLSRHVECMNSNKEILDYLYRKTIRKAFRVIFTVPEYPYLLSTSVYRDFHNAGIWLHAVLIELKRFLKILDSRDREVFKKWLEEIEVDIDRGRLFESYYTSREFLKDLADLFLLFRLPVFFDEFHLYTGFSLASFMALLYIYLVERGIGKIIISSATPEKTILVKGKRKDFLDLVKKLALLMKYNVVEVTADTSTEPGEDYDQVRKKTMVVIKPIVLRGRQVTGAPAFGAIQREIPSLIGESDWIEKFKSIGRSMIIVDRVASVLEIGDKIEKLIGEKPVLICSIKRLIHENTEERRVDLRQARIVVGNMAIAFGIDIEGMDLGVIVAKDYPSALQKIGRIGRGRGDNIAIVYLPIPFYKYRDLEKDNYFEKLNGREIPYVSSLSEVDFLRVLKKVYPRQRSDILVRHKASILRIALSTWAYTLTNIIRLRTEIREVLETSEKLEDVPYIREYTLLLRELEAFFEIENLARKLRKYVKHGLYLTPLGLFYFYSYRTISGVVVKRETRNGEIIEEVIDLVTAGRNIPLEYRQGEFYVKPGGKLYEYTILEIEVEEQNREHVKKPLKILDGKIVCFKYLARTLGGYAFLCQSSRCQDSRDRWPLIILADNSTLQDLPVLVIDAEGDKKKINLIEYLSATESVIPIKICRGTSGGSRQCEIIGGIYLL